MTDDELEIRLARELRAQAPEPTWDFRDRVMAELVNVPQQGRGIAGWLPIPASPHRFALILATAALLVGLVAGAIAVGSGLFKLPSILPLPSPTVEASAEATPSISVEPTPGEPLGLVAYTITELVDPPPPSCTGPLQKGCYVQRIVVANADGTNAHELLPDVPGDQSAIAWLPDGSGLLYSEARGLVLTDVSGSQQEVITSTQCPVGTITNCPNLGGSLSPDGTRLAYTLFPGTQADSSIVAIFDLTTRQITMLESTRTTGLDLPCITAARQGDNGSPQWSPDGTRLVVSLRDIGPLDERGNCRSMVFSVNADGTDFQVVVPSGTRQQPSSGGWSPDGSHLVLSSIEADPNGGSDATFDIAIVRPDGSDLHQLTSDGISGDPLWTRDGRILFVKRTDLEAGTFDLWIMDADGTNPRLLRDRSIAALSAIGCVVCPADPERNWSDVLWQPIP